MTDEHVPNQPTAEPIEVEAVGDLEVRDEDSEAIKGGEVTFEYGALQVRYVPQNAD